MNVAGKNVVVTGKIAGESRDTAERKLREAGAKVQGSVNAKTDLLVTGAAVGKTKLTAAAKNDVVVVPWEEIELDGKPASRSEAGPRKAVDAPPVAPVREIGPMLAKAGEIPLAAGWCYEIKWDGIRCIATIKDGAVAMQSRSGKTDLGEKYPHIARALAAGPNCVIDGEIVVLDASGASSFQSLVGSGQRAGAEQFIAFDCLEVEGEDARALPLSKRRALLTHAVFEHAGFKASTLLAISPAFPDGMTLYGVAVEQELEGLVSKRLDSPYREGKKSTDWIKTKIRVEQEFVVVGFTEGLGARAGTAGAFLLAVYDDESDEFIYCGNAGTGGTLDDFKALVEQMEALPEEPENLKHGLTRAKLRDVTWVAPEIVVQVKFQRWTEDGMLWHPSIQGQRTDKAAHEVRREDVPA